MTENWLIPLMALACLVFAVACWWFWRRQRRTVRQIVALHQDVVESAEASTFGQRVSRSGLSEELGATKLICFGDSENDLSMFAVADESYAPSSACGRARVFCATPTPAIRSSRSQVDS